MNYFPEFHHGQSHETDMDWLHNLPTEDAVIVGDGVTKRWRLKFEARSFARVSMSGTKLLDILSLMENNSLQDVIRIITDREGIGSYELDSEDSHYVIIEPALKVGQVAVYKYHYVRPL